MILGKSNHPVIMNRIKVVSWTLRDEIEYAVEQLKKTNSQNFDQQYQIVKAYYQKSPRIFDQAQGAAEQTTNPNGIVGEVDDEMAAMAAALEQNDQEKPAGDDANPVEATTSTEDAAKLAEMMEGNTMANPVEAMPSVAKKSNFKGLIPPIDKLSPGFLFLNDINMEDAVISSVHGYQLGMSVNLDFIIPLRFKLSGVVIGCKALMDSSKIISPTRPRYRVLIKFTFIHDGERTSLRNFLKSIEPKIPAPVKKAAKETSDSDSDDDLSDFGF